MNLHRSAVLFLLAASLAASAAAQPSAKWRARTRLAQQMHIGESAPDWLMNAETYALGVRDTDWDALARSKITFVTHCPVNREFFARCHALGIHCFPYVTFYQGFANRTYEGINLKDHPDYIEVDAKGRYKRTGFWDSEDAKNMYTICPNVKGYQDAMVAWVRKIMEMGADGVFVDNLGSREPCYGPKFGKHKHIYADQNHAFAMLLKRVRAVVKHYKPDGAVLGNSANPPSLPKEFWPYLDADMLESYICTWVSTDRWFDWKTHWDQVGKDLQPYVRAGKQIQALSYLGHTHYGVRADALFCYASARLAGFVWCSGVPLSDPDVEDLNEIRLGKPLTGELEQDGVHYRIFERGLVAVNPEKDHARSITIGSAAPTQRLFELADGMHASGWDPYGAGGYAVDAGGGRSGSRAIVCTGASGGASGASQVVTLDQTKPAPVVISGWSKAENVTGTPSGDYSLYADVVYTDGTPLYGQTARFSTGTHDWERASVTIEPAKPVRSLTLHALFRGRAGRVWFDDVSVEADGAELVRNDGFETSSRRGQIVDASAAGGRVSVPAYSGRVFLFAPQMADQLATSGPHLTVVTSPGLGEVRFRVDGFDYWTHSGRWTTVYEKGPEFGKFDIVFDKPGKHTVEIMDVVPADMQTSSGYGSPERLGKFMDPSNPTKPSAGRKFRFREWLGRGKQTKITVDVTKDTTLTAVFDVEEHK